MEWKRQVDSFFEKAKSSLSFDAFFHERLELDSKDFAQQWEILSQHLGKWNDEYLVHYEKISLYSPVAWTLGLVVNCFHAPKNKSLIENWLYWAFLSADVNDSVLNGLNLKIEENRRNPQQFFLKSQASLGWEVGQILKMQDLYYLLEQDYVWIDNKTFLQEFAQKRKRSYQRFLGNCQNSSNTEDSYASHMLLMYERYQEYEHLFRNAMADGTDFGVAALNPQGMGDLEDDCMWYFLRTDDFVYLLCFGDYY